MSVPGFAKAVSIGLVLVPLYLLYAPNLLDIEPLDYNPQYVRFEGALSLNKDLDRSKLVVKDQVVAPEGLVHRNGNLYLSSADGRIVTVKDDKVLDTLVNITKVTGMESRPLGLRLHKQDLYIADGFQGLLKFDMNTGQLTTLLSGKQVINGIKLGVLDDLEIDDQGVLYLSDATTRWSLHQVMYALVEHAKDGRIITYDTRTGKYDVLLDNLFFPNGIQISHDKKYLLICETTERRILRYYLKGPKKGSTEVFAYVPGEPDNIRPSSGGGYWVAMPFGSKATGTHAIHGWACNTKTRKILARLSHMAGTGLGFINHFLPVPILEHWENMLKSGLHFLNLYNVDGGTVVELDEEGRIVRSLQSQNPQFLYLTHPEEVDGHLYLGSFFHNCIVKVPL